MSSDKQKKVVMSNITYFVTRHADVIEWAERKNLGNIVQVRHFDPSVIKSGDRVVGSLSVSLVAEINRLGGHYGDITLSLTESDRGKELSSADMDRLGAKIEWFYVAAVQPQEGGDQQIYRGSMADCDSGRTDRNRFEISIEKSGEDQLFVAVGSRNGGPALELAIEVHENVPAVHVGGMLYSEPLIHIHAGADGLYVTPHDADAFEPATANALTYGQEHSFFAPIVQNYTAN